MYRLFLLLFLFAACSSVSVWSASGDDAHPAAAAGSAATSAAGFDWRSTLPYLDKAADLSEEDGLRELLENLAVFRTYIANDLLSQGVRPVGDTAVTQKIDQLVHEGLFRRRKITRVDYRLSRQPFPFTFLAAVKTSNHHDAYLVLYPVEKSYTAAQVQAQYGPPPSTNIVGTASLYTYKLETATYAARATFTIDPVDGTVDRLAISLKRKRGHN